ncbi:MAG: hypothetical protein ACFE0I_17405 [Elainellaceae cyanobacterium]
MAHEHAIAEQNIVKWQGFLQTGWAIAPTFRLLTITPFFDIIWNVQEQSSRYQATELGKSRQIAQN